MTVSRDGVRIANAEGDDPAHVYIDATDCPGYFGPPPPGGGG